MPGPEFWRTVMGSRMIEGDVPAIREALKAIATTLPELTKALQLVAVNQAATDVKPAAQRSNRATLEAAGVQPCHAEHFAEMQSDRSHWDDDPRFSVADWKYEVANDDTRQSYREWRVSTATRLRRHVELNDAVVET